MSQTAILSQPGIRKVTGIIPVELLRAARSGEFDMDKFLSEQEKTQAKEEKQRLAKEAKEQKKAERLENKIAKKDEKTYQRVRENLIKEVFNVNTKTLEELKQDDLEFRLGEKDVKSQIEAVINEKNVWKGQEGANKRAKKDLIMGLAAAIGMGAIKVFAPILSAGIDAFTALSYVIMGKAILSGGYSFAKWSKAKVGNKADAYGKHRDYINMLEPFLNDVSKLNDAIEEDRELLIRKSKEMSKSEFKDWSKNYINAKAEELGIEPNKDFKLKEQIQSGQNLNSLGSVGTTNIKPQEVAENI